MNKSKHVFALTFALLLSACSLPNESSLINDDSSSNQSSSLKNDSNEEDSSFLGESSDSSNEKTISKEDSSATEETSSSKESSVNESSSFESSETNPDGSTKLDPPSNYLNPVDFSSSYFNFDVSSYSNKPLEGGFSLIYGNSKYDTPSYNKYENNEDNPKVNGLKMDYFDRHNQGRSYIGLQSPCMVTNKKIEFRFKVSSSHGTTKKNGNDKYPLFTIYSFNEDCSLINTSKYFNSDYGKSILNNGDVKVYITPASEVRYFELRFNQAPYSSSKQSFNFNISSLTIRQWEYE